MRHHPQDIAADVANASDVVQRPIGIGVGSGLAVLGAVAEDHPRLLLEALERRRVGAEIALPMRDRDAQYLAGAAIDRAGRAALLDAQVNLPAPELARGIIQPA